MSKQLDQSTSPVIAPVYQQSQINEPIEFGKVDVEYEFSGKHHKGQGSASMKFVPDYRLLFTCPFTDTSPVSGLKALLTGDGTAKIALTGRGISCDAFCNSITGNEAVFSTVQSAL